MRRFHELDGFQLFSGVASLTAGPVMLLMGAPAGWAFLIMAAGTLVLVAQWAILAEVRFDTPDATTVALAIAGMACIAVAVVYLTAPRTISRPSSPDTTRTPRTSNSYPAS